MAVNLKKGQKISLAKPSGGNLKKVVLGLGWDPADGRSEIDLDANAVTYNGSGKALAQVWFRNLQAHKYGGGLFSSAKYAITHTGDNRTGDGDGDDEQIIVDLENLPADVKSVVFSVASWSRHSFKNIVNAFVRVVDAESGEELCRYTLAENPDNTGMIMGRVTRGSNGWEFTALGEPANGQSVQDQLSAMAAARG